MFLVNTFTSGDIMPLALYSFHYVNTKKLWDMSRVRTQHCLPGVNSQIRHHHLHRHHVLRDRRPILLVGTLVVGVVYQKQPIADTAIPITSRLYSGSETQLQVQRNQTQMHANCCFYRTVNSTGPVGLCAPSGITVTFAIRIPLSKGRAIASTSS
ncbi:hypothetical protein BC938DRAFT_477624 [Jimgerdemannia flammicorona]|uniref:Uncharacterized protein n=1 Tax=Jimgerdemannia flammicorona TaxID=994334 RepID=A0A433QP18_9FUNG|nr:hypothetical protein BC938DRAFT_477624 [Jimgerdemannia flammicorona]